ncbi:hypothetical protein [Rhizobium halophytocola]|uniref:Uncharacterized protein n=1 Tax=Rhizobium halophytocola TaxID=735519 RepID=A0ABS4DVW5_9HYPH|nr:hypothetical protein [Rhizobium halophytocola]MBP1849842.1 hypothetical protein [Rhizobium halophytocola]
MGYDWDGTRTKRMNLAKTLGLMFLLYSAAAGLAVTGSLLL